MLIFDIGAIIFGVGLLIFLLYSIFIPRRKKRPNMIYTLMLLPLLGGLPMLAGGMSQHFGFSITDSIVYVGAMIFGGVIGVLLPKPKKSKR